MPARSEAYLRALVANGKAERSLVQCTTDHYRLTTRTARRRLEEKVNSACPVLSTKMQTAFVHVYYGSRLLPDHERERLDSLHSLLHFVSCACHSPVSCLENCIHGSHITESSSFLSPLFHLWPSPTYTTPAQRTNSSSHLQPDSTSWCDRGGRMALRAAAQRKQSCYAAWQ